MNTTGSIEKTQAIETITTYLKQKYNDNFEIKSLKHMFDGDNGFYYRAVCISEKYGDEFAVFGYTDSSDAEQSLMINDDLCRIEDTYAEVVFQNNFLDMIECTETSEYIIRCKLDFHGRYPSNDEFKEGFESCISKNELFSYLMVYIITKDGFDSTDIQNEIKELIARVNPCYGYVYVAKKSKYDRDSIINDHRQNQHNFSSYLSNTDFAEKVTVAVYENNNGFRTAEIIKE